MSLDWQIVRFGCVDSTMDVLDERARGGAAEGLVVVADVQTAGRGRAGRAWTAAPESSLLCSILLRPRLMADRLGPLPLVIGVAVAQAIESFVDARCELKWPNDVLIEERKIAGILLQSRLGGDGIDWLNVGIGVNVSATGEQLPPGATSIAAAGGTADRDALLLILLRRLDVGYRDWARSGGRPNLDEWRRRASLLGELVTLIRDTSELHGTFLDVDADGRMELRLESGEMVQITQGDVARGPRRRDFAPGAPG